MNPGRGKALGFIDTVILVNRYSYKYSVVIVTKIEAHSCAGRQVILGL